MPIVLVYNYKRSIRSKLYHLVVQRYKELCYWLIRNLNAFETYGMPSRSFSLSKPLTPNSFFIKSEFRLTIRFKS